jgi:hypothetical protein
MPKRLLLPILVAAGTLTSVTYVSADQTLLVCHGEYYSRCQQHPFQIFEHCGDDNGVGGADPKNISGPNICGPGVPFDIQPADGGSIGGNHCGYSWYRVVCHN